jgi:hypothetical protein
MLFGGNVKTLIQSASKSPLKSQKTIKLSQKWVFGLRGHDEKRR